MLPIFAKAPCCLELFECCCRRLSQLLIPLRHCLRDASFCVCLGSGSFCHEWASHCSVLFWSLDALFVFLGSPPLPPWCGKFKPKLVQKSFLRKSQDLHPDAVPTTYAQRSLRKRGSHTQALRFGTAQPLLDALSEVR